MSLKRIIKKERKIWHKHFIPSLIAGIGMAIVTLAFDVTVFGVVMFSSVGASAVILANNQSHHLTKLRTTIFAYISATVISGLVFLLNKIIPIHLSINLFLIVFLVAIIMYLLDTFHPPAISAAAAFLLLEREIADLIFLFVTVIAILVFVRFFSYIFSQHLSVKEFIKEFKKEF